FKIPFGPYVLPLSSARVETLRKGEPVWRMLWDRHIPVTIMHMPTNFPPEGVGEAIAGMGVPDLRGTQGTFTFYTDDEVEVARDVPGGRIVKVQAENGRYVLPVEGPPNPLRKDRRFATQDLIVEADPERDVARLTIGGAAAIVQRGEWSEWLRADFPLLGWLAGGRGMFRVYAKEFHPRLALYVTPVNIDPRAPELPISAPASYSRVVAGAIGPFYTQGIAEDTSAYRQGVLTMEEVLRFFYFSSIDQGSHMLGGKHEPELLEIYRAVDAAVGEAARRFPRADMIVMSDHGFNSFDRSVNLNTWLWEKGFLALQGRPRGGDEGFADVDWTKTQAYALGLNGLYLNIAGREKNGILRPGAETEAVMRRLARELAEFRDPVNGRQVVETAPATGAAMGPEGIVGDGAGRGAAGDSGRQYGRVDWGSLH